MKYQHKVYKNRAIAINKYDISPRELPLLTVTTNGSYHRGRRSPRIRSSRPFLSPAEYTKATPHPSPPADAENVSPTRRHIHTYMGKARLDIRGGETR